MTLAGIGKKDSARKELQKYDQQVLEENNPYGMTSNRGNFHNRVSSRFLYAAYLSGDLGLAKKVNISLKRDLEQQMKYYRSLGDQGNNEQLANDASQYMQSRGGNLSQGQEVFAEDIVTSYQMLMQLAQWEKDFKSGGPAENPVDTLNTPTPAKPDTGKR
jgi:hypothetical protein